MMIYYFAIGAVNRYALHPLKIVILEMFLLRFSLRIGGFR